MYKCNKCYHAPDEREGCFTTDVTRFIMENMPPCLDGTWHIFKPEFNLINIGENE